MPGHKRVWAQTYKFVPRHDCNNTIVTCQSTNVSGHNRVGTNVSGHNRVGTIMWAQAYMGHKRVVSAFTYSFFREVLRLGTLGHFIVPGCISFSRSCVWPRYAWAPGAVVVFCRIKGKSRERFRFRHEKATTKEAWCKILQCCLHQPIIAQ